MPWIKVEIGLERNPKTAKLAQALNINIHETMGYLIQFWSYVLEFAEDGNISKWSEINISKAAGWSQDPKVFYDALTRNGGHWIDVKGKKKFIHDWDYYSYAYRQSKYHTSSPEKLKKAKGIPLKNDEGTPLPFPDKIREDKIRVYTVHFEKLWIKYPVRVGKKQALRHFLASIKTDKDVVDITLALENYLKSSRVAKGYVQNAATWFNNWEDWIGYTEQKEEKVRYE